MEAGAPAAPVTGAAEAGGDIGGASAAATALPRGSPGCAAAFVTGVGVRGARFETTESGSEPRPILWVASWLADQATAALAAIPSSAATIQIRLRRSTFTTT